MKVCIIISCLCALLLSACVNFKPQADKVKLYTLGMNAAVAADDPGDKVTYYIARPELPGYLQGNRMLYHTDSGELASISGARWGEDLAGGIARALGEYMHSDGRVYVRSYFPWPKLSRETLDIRVLFKRFGATETGHVQLVAIWQIRNGDGLIKEGQFQSLDLRWNPDQTETYVTQLNAALSALAQDISSSL